MIKKVRRKFITIAMSAIIGCTLLLILAINALNFFQVNKEISNLMYTISENNGQFPGKLPSGSMDQFSTEDAKNMPEDMPGFSKEAAYETRFFTVNLYSETEWIANLRNIATIDEELAVQMARDVISEKNDSGYYGNYKFLVSEQADSVQVTFIDCESRIDSMISLAWTSLFIAAIGITLMFIIIALFSKKAIQPVIESTEKQKQFITDASHELKTPLTVIATNMDILSMDIGKNEWVEGTQKQVLNLKSLVNNMISLSRLEEENQQLITGRFSLSRAVAETVESFMPMADFEGKIMEALIEEQIDTTGDENGIRQMVAILCDNAVKYTPQKGHIEVSLKKNGKRAELIVSNDCEEKLTDDNLKKIFDRFYRADASRTAQSGKHSYGIGLALAKAIAEKHNTKITVTQNMDKKIYFQILFEAKSSCNAKENDL
ncbi:MAG: sensor histidine kinase [Lachnospiraceae bacterium]